MDPKEAEAIDHIIGKYRHALNLCRAVILATRSYIPEGDRPRDWCDDALKAIEELVGSGRVG